MTEFLIQVVIFLIYIFSIKSGRPLVFQTMNSDRSNNLNLKYQRFTVLYCIDIGIRTFEMVTKTQLLFNAFNLTQIAEKCLKIPETPK